MKRATLPSFLIAILILISNSSFAQENRSLRQTWDWIWRYNSRFTVPYEKFAVDMTDEKKRYQTYQWLRNHDPDFTVSFEEFSLDLLSPREDRIHLSRPDWQQKDPKIRAPITLCDQADSLSKVEEYRRAIYVYTIIIDTNEPCEMVYFNRGHCKASAGDHRGAITDLKTYLDSVKGLEHKGFENKDNPFTIWYVQLAYLTIGNCYLFLGNVEEGCLSYGKAGEYGAEEAYQYMKEFCN